MSEKVKRSIHDRYDRKYLGDLDSMHVIMPYIMPERCNNEAVLDVVIDVTSLNDYLARKNAGSPEFKYTWFHVITAALSKTLLLRPKMNWFISGFRMYERRDIVVSFNVKRTFEDHSEEAIAKFVVDREGGSLVDQVHDYVQKFVHAVRHEGKSDGATSKMNILKYLPRPLLKFFFWALRRLEYHGFYPKAFRFDDPTFSSVYISNLGSIKMNADYHHLYENGTISFFVVINERKMRPVFHDDGSYEMKDTIKLGLTIDERIADGYYFAKSLRLLNKLLQEPDLLDLPAAAPIDFA